MEGVQEIQPKGTHVTHGMLQKISNFKFLKISSTLWHGAVDQDWRSKSCTPKCTS